MLPAFDFGWKKLTDSQSCYTYEYERKDWIHILWIFVQS